MISIYMKKLKTSMFVNGKIKKIWNMKMRHIKYVNFEEL